MSGLVTEAVICELEFCIFYNPLVLQSLEDRKCLRDGALSTEHGARVPLGDASFLTCCSQQIFHAAYAKVESALKL